MVKNNPGEPYSRISSEEALEMQKKGDSTVIDVRNDCLLYTSPSPRD